MMYMTLQAFSLLRIDLDIGTQMTMLLVLMLTKVGLQAFHVQV
jgi:hypothetical protein